MVDIILEKMSDAPDDSNVTGQTNTNYANQPGAYNRGATKLTANDQQMKSNQCQC